MKATVDTKTLKQTLNSMNLGKGAFEWLLVEADAEGFVWLTTTNLDVSISKRIPAEVVGDWAHCAPVKDLKKIIGTIKSPTVELYADDETFVVAIPNMKYLLPGTLPSEFPQNMCPDVDPWHISGAHLIDLVERTGFAASSDDSRPIINSVYFHTTDDHRLVAVATNGHMLARRAHLNGKLPSLDLLVYRGAVPFIGKVFDPDDKVEVRADNQWISFRATGKELVARRIEGPYPLYQNVIPTEFDCVAQGDRTELLELIKHLLPVTPPENNRITFTFDPNQSVVEASDPGGPSVVNFVPVTYEGPKMKVSVNARYLADLLKHMPGERVQIRFNHPERAIRIEPVDNADYMTLLMPLAPLK